MESVIYKVHAEDIQSTDSKTRNTAVRSKAKLETRVNQSEVIHKITKQYIAVMLDNFLNISVTREYTLQVCHFRRQWLHGIAKQKS